MFPQRALHNSQSQTSCRHRDDDDDGTTRKLKEEYLCNDNNNNKTFATQSNLYEILRAQVKSKTETFLFSTTVWQCLCAESEVASYYSPHLHCRTCIHPHKRFVSIEHRTHTQTHIVINAIDVFFEIKWGWLWGRSIHATTLASLYGKLHCLLFVCRVHYVSAIPIAVQKRVKRWCFLCKH